MTKIFRANVGLLKLTMNDVIPFDSASSVGKFEANIPKSIAYIMVFVMAMCSLILCGILSIILRH